eukprot:TRINITY_DN4997_c0_g1_i1.p1 TRINITY_DN4997_c0_g1~~TRINITY_DN4997_c0_g1_i1.p1  ORF type:complete len:320 (+),score=58.94 TRINITY_DN4997_c0_g1_i1:55-1014(+)
MRSSRLWTSISRSGISCTRTSVFAKQLAKRSSDSSLRLVCVRMLSSSTNSSEASPSAAYESYEIGVRRSTDWKVLITAEHAAVTLPPGVTWPKEDQWLVGTHWSYDPGSYDFTKEIASSMGGVPYVTANFSRLYVDPNRPLSSDTLFRNVAEGRAIELNKTIDANEREKRLERCYRPFHSAIDQVIERDAPNINVVLSLHSFTPLYEGKKRQVEVGVLFNEDDTLAKPVYRYLTEKGYDARLNEPWSGKEGLMYSSERAARLVKSTSNKSTKRSVLPLMLEFRQDLVVIPQWRAKMIEHLLSVFRSEELAHHFLFSSHH